MGDPTVTVFEIANDSAKEIYVGATAGPVSDAVDRLRREPPPQLAGWDFSRLPAGCVRIVDSGLTPDTVRGFIKRYSSGDLPDGWRYLADGAV